MFKLIHWKSDLTQTSNEISTKGHINLEIVQSYNKVIDDIFKSLLDPILTCLLSVYK